MALTRRFVVLMLPAVSFDVPSALLGLKSPVASLSLRQAPGALWLVPRDGGEPIVLPVSPGFVFHWAAAWEDRDHDPEGPDRLVFDGVKYDAFPRLDDVDGVMASGEPLVAYMVRWTVDLGTGAVVEQRLHDLPVELPTAMGTGPERVVFATGAPAGRRQPYLSALVRHGPDGVSMRELAPDLPGEPLVCGRWLVTQVWRAHTASSEVWVVDPDTLQTVARLGLPAPVPPALHGVWLGAG
jgi:carotenoid cleavage dioxygenase-like enzyme